MDGLVQERRNSIANALELRLSCTNLSKCSLLVVNSVWCCFHFVHSVCVLGADSIWRCHLTSIGNPIVEIRRYYDCLISTMGFPIPVRQHLHIESGPWFRRRTAYISMACRLAQDCGNSCALAMELLQSYTRPSICCHPLGYIFSIVWGQFDILLDISMCMFCMMSICCIFCQEILVYCILFFLKTVQCHLINSIASLYHLSIIIQWSMHKATILKEYEHGLCFVVVWAYFTHIFQGYFTGTGQIIPITMVPVKQPNRIWVNISHQSTRTHTITTV